MPSENWKHFRQRSVRLETCHYCSANIAVYENVGGIVILRACGECAIRISDPNEDWQRWRRRYQGWVDQT